MGTFKVLQETRIEKIRLRNTANSADSRIATFIKNVSARALHLDSLLTFSNTACTLQTGISDGIRARYSGPRDRCAFTGPMGDGAGVGLHWIFPPFLFDMVRSSQ